MTFIEALSEYHKGKRIRRESWQPVITWVNPNYPIGEYPIYWDEVLATDWIAEDG